MLEQAAELFKNGHTVRQVAAALRVSKTEAGRLRLRASDSIEPGANPGGAAINGHGSMALES